MKAEERAKIADAKQRVREERVQARIDRNHLKNERHSTIGDIEEAMRMNGRFLNWPQSNKGDVTGGGYGVDGKSGIDDIYWYYATGN